MAVASMLAPGDFESQQAAIDRKRKIIDMLAQQTAAPQGQMVSGHYIAPNVLAQLADLGGGALQAFGNKALDEQSAQNNQDYQTGMGDAVQKYLKTRAGYDEAPQGPTPDGGNLPVQHVAGDPRQAMVDAISSQYKPLQQMGMAELGQMGKQSMSPKDFFALTGENKYTPTSVKEAAMTGDMSKLVPMGKVQAVNGQLVNVVDNSAPSVMGDYRDKFGNIGSVGTDGDGKPILGQRNLGTGEAKFAPTGGTTVNVDTGAKGASALSVALNQAAVKRLQDSQETASKAQGTYGLFQNAANLINDLPGGLASQPIQSAKRVLAAFGVDDPSITSFEQVNQALKTAVLDNAHIFGTGNGFTDKDREELGRIVGADPSLTPQTLQFMVNKGLATSLNTLKSHSRLVDTMGAADGADPRIIKAFDVPVPHYSLDPDSFGVDPSSGLFFAKGAGLKRAEAAKTSGGLTPEQQARYEYLAKKHGVK